MSKQKNLDFFYKALKSKNAESLERSLSDLQA
ncbi:MAG: hypothetical protein ACJAW3_001247 [Lentimonas sp.]|jgi:hypothetical protein